MLRANQTVAIQACHMRGLITKYVMIVAGGLGAEPLATGR